MFEREVIAPMMRASQPDMEVKSWADSVGRHYGRKRRVELLEEAGKIVSSGSEDGSFEVEVEGLGKPTLEVVTTSAHPNVVAVQGDEEANGWRFDNDGDGEDALDDPHHDADDQSAAWNLEDDSLQSPFLSASSVQVEPPETAQDIDVDADDVWGLADEDETAESIEDADNGDAETDDMVWDDAWNEPPSPKAAAPLVVPPTIQQPKVATRLERFAQKDKSVSSTKESSHASPALISPPTTSYSNPPSMSLQLPMSVNSPMSMKSASHSARSSDINVSGSEPLKIHSEAKLKRETYVVSARAKNIF